MESEGNNVLVIIQCRKEVLKPSWMSADLGEIRFTRMLILLLVLQKRVMEIYNADFPEPTRNLFETVAHLAKFIIRYL